LHPFIKHWQLAPFANVTLKNTYINFAKMNIAFPKIEHDTAMSQRNTVHKHPATLLARK